MSAIGRLKKFLKRCIQGDYLPCTVLSWKPFILVSYDVDFLKERDCFLKYFARDPSHNVHLFLQLGWQHSEEDEARPFACSLKECMALCPNLRITVLANFPEELQAMERHGIHSVLCHQNAFLDPAMYRIVPDAKKHYDALYVARVTPFKRHYLAEKVRSLCLVACWSEREKAYADDIRRKLAHAKWLGQVPAGRIYRVMNACRCGLCLSAEEGAMFVSAEYLLCGLPIVNTRNIGGRDELFPDFAVKQVPDDPAAVAAAVAEFAAHAPDPQKIRNAVLEKMKPHRALLHELLNAICREEHAQDPSVPAEFHGKFLHKLGLRCTRLPWINWKYGLKRREGLS